MSARRIWTRSTRALCAASLAAALLCAAATGAFSAEPPPAGANAPRAVDRRVVVLYNGNAGQTATDNIGYEGFQTILNYYGLMAEYVDASQRPLPSDEGMTGVLAVIEAFNSPSVDDPVPLFKWMLHQCDAGRKLLACGMLVYGSGYDGSEEAQTLHSDIFEHLGFKVHRLPFMDRSKLRFVQLDPSMTGYESKYPELPPHYIRIEPLRPGIRPLVTVERTDKEDSASVMAAVTPTGGLLVPGYDYWREPLHFQRKWYIDPFGFLRESLGLGNTPVPDPTTLNGLRVAFSHVDADGFSGSNQIDRKKVCAEIMRDAVLKTFDFPISYSVIQAEIDPEVQGSWQLMDVARSIMELPNIEPASHTFSHPFFWNPDNLNKDRYDDRFAFDIPGYTFDAYKEIVDSVDFVTNQLCPPGKSCHLLFWSGACDPLAEHQKLAADNGILAINGGDTVWDPARNSLFRVSPLVRELGEGQFQVHIGQCNDNILTNLWRGPFNGYRNIIETLKRTGSPRRLKPIDIYYHTFSAEKIAGIEAIKEVYSWVLSQPVAPVWTSWYVRSIQDWTGARVSRTGPGLYRIENYGTCLTARLDEGSPLPDLSRCENILGYDAQPQGLYVHLSPGARSAVLALAGPGETPSRVPHVRTANGVVRDFSRVGNVLRAALDFTVVKGVLTLAGLEPGCTIQAQGTATGGRTLTATADGQGGLTLAGLESGGMEIRLP